MNFKNYSNEDFINLFSNKSKFFKEINFKDKDLEKFKDANINLTWYDLENYRWYNLVIYPFEIKINDKYNSINLSIVENEDSLLLRIDIINDKRFQHFKYIKKVIPSSNLFMRYELSKIQLFEFIKYVYKLSNLKLYE